MSSIWQRTQNGLEYAGEVFVILPGGQFVMVRRFLEDSWRLVGAERYFRSLEGDDQIDYLTEAELMETFDD